MEKKQKISFLTLLSLVIGSVIGIGIFFKSGRVLNLSGGDSGLAITAWSIGGFISIAAALTVAEIGSLLKDTGGLSSMMRIGGEVISLKTGRLLSFLTGWFQVFYMGGLIASLCYYFPTFLFAALGMNPAEVSPILYILMGFVTLFVAFGTNVISAAFGGWVAKLSVVIKVIPLILIVFFGIVMPFVNKSAVPQTVGFLPNFTSDHGGQSILAILGLTLPAVLFSYDGWLFSTTVAEEVENPGKNIPLAILGGIVFVTFIYVFANVGVIASGKPSAPAALAHYFGGQWAANITNVIIAISAYGVVNGYGILSQRFVYGLAENNNFFAPKFFSRKLKNGFPFISGLAMALVVVLYLLVQYFVPVTATAIEGKAIDTVVFYGAQADYLSDMLTVEMWILYIVLFVLTLVNRLKNMDQKQAFKLPIWALILCVVTAASGAMFFVYQNIVGAYGAPASANALTLGIPTFLLQFIALMLLGSIVYYTTGINKQHEKIVK